MPNIPVTPLTKKDEQGNVIASITPVLKVIERGEMEGSVYPTIEVTQSNLNDYVKVRGLERVLSVINARERLDAQATLEYTIDNEDAWEEVEGMTDKEGKPRQVWTYVLEKFTAVISKFYDTLLSGKVRGGVTIKDLKEEQEALFAEMQAKIGEMVKAAPDKAREIMLEANALSLRHQEISAQVVEIQKSRKPRKTKAEKIAELQAQAAQASKSQVAA